MSIDEDLYCSFCGCHAADCVHIYRGPRAAICGVCALSAVGVMLHGWHEIDPQHDAEQQALKNAERAKPWLDTKALP
jgi:hypothetical protein